MTFSAAGEIPCALALAFMIARVSELPEKCDLGQFIACSGKSRIEGVVIGEAAGIDGIGFLQLQIPVKNVVQLEIHKFFRVPGIAYFSELNIQQVTEAAQAFHARLVPGIEVAGDNHRSLVSGKHFVQPVQFLLEAVAGGEIDGMDIGQQQNLSVMQQMAGDQCTLARGPQGFPCLGHMCSGVQECLRRGRQHAVDMVFDLDVWCGYIGIAGQGKILMLRDFGFLQQQEISGMLMVQGLDDTIEIVMQGLLVNVPGEHCKGLAWRLT